MAQQSNQKRTAQKRIEELFAQAKDKPAHAKRYIALARKIALRNNASIPKSLRKQFCTNCNSLFIFGKNCTVRVRPKTITITCTGCNKPTRIARPQ